MLRHIRLRSSDPADDHRVAFPILLVGNQIADYALCAFVEFAAAEQHGTASYGAASRAGKC
jgi:hypothetical protein